MPHRTSSLLLASTLATALWCIAPPGHAATNIDNLGAANQPEFRLFSEDLGSALSDKALIPTAPLGLTGFDVGIEATDTEITNTSAWDVVTGNSGKTSLVLPKIHVYKGLPLGFDVGAFYSQVPNSNIKLWGAELRYALLSGGVTEPAVGIEANYTKLQGVNQLDFHTTGLDLSVSKGFTLLTPYIGIGEVWVNSNPIGISSLQTERFSLNKYFIGADLNFAILNMAVEADRTGNDTTYGLKLGWRF